MNRITAAPLVNRFVRGIAWPALRELGFDRFTARSAWRTRTDVIEVVNFQSAVNASGDPIFLGSSGNGPGREASLGSFALNVGTYYTVRSLLPWPLSGYSQLKDPDRPEEWTCHERLRIETTRMQAADYPSYMFEVSSREPSAARDAVIDALAAFREKALPWFDENQDLERAFSRLKPGCWNWARDIHRQPDQLFRCEDLFAALAIRTGHTDEALRLFQTIAARPVSAPEREAYDKDEARRLRRLARTKESQLRSTSAKPKPLIVESVPFWHDGASTRVHLLQELSLGSHRA